MGRIEVIERALVRIAGLDSGPPLLFIHAFGDTGHCYNRVFRSRRLAQYRLIAVDLWGFGASPARSDVRTVAEYSGALETLILKVCPGQTVGLIGHSIAGSMAVEIATQLGNRICGVFSIEGNLTADDAMFTGKASNFDDPDTFKMSFLNDVWEMSQSSEALRHYYAAARMADSETMWNLGRDAKRISEENKLGEAFRGLQQPSNYYWSTASTPQKTRQWIEQSGIPNEIYSGAGHWPMIEQPEATAQSITDFFGGHGAESTTSELGRVLTDNGRR